MRILKLLKNKDFKKLKHLIKIKIKEKKKKNKLKQHNKYNQEL